MGASMDAFGAILPTTARKPLVRWDIYLARHTPARWLGTVEAPDADDAIAEAVRQFGLGGKKLIAVREGG